MEQFQRRGRQAPSQGRCRLRGRAARNLGDHVSLAKGLMHPRTMLLSKLNIRGVVGGGEKGYQNSGEVVPYQEGCSV